MLEIVFSDSAAGALAQASGLGVLYPDICPFHLALSVGGISESGIGPQRKAALVRLMEVFPDSGEEAAAELFSSAQKNLARLRSRAGGGEPVRIWSSRNPDEACGLCWLMEQLQPVGFSQLNLTLVLLPEFELRPDGAAVRWNSWSEVSPRRWEPLAAQGNALPASLAQAMARHWSALRQENAPLRAVLNGRLSSGPENLYDSFIRRELDAAPREFMQAVVIGRVLGKYQLGISDAWIALRMERLIQDGCLRPVSAPDPGVPVYHRMLQKC